MLYKSFVNLRIFFTSLILTTTVGVGAANAAWELICAIPRESCYLAYIPDGSGIIAVKVPTGGWGDDGGCTNETCVGAVLSAPGTVECLQGGGSVFRGMNKFFCNKRVERGVSHWQKPPINTGSLRVAGSCFSSLTTGLAVREGRYLCLPNPGPYIRKDPPTAEELKLYAK